jgi:hypothetical protein
MRHLLRPFCTSGCTHFPSPVNSLIATATELLNSCLDVADASMYSESVVLFTAQAFCTECEEPYLHCCHKAGGAHRSRQRPGLQPTFREQRDAVTLDYAVFTHDRVTAESRFIGIQKGFTLRVKTVAAGDSQFV